MNICLSLFIYYSVFIGNISCIFSYFLNGIWFDLEESQLSLVLAALDGLMSVANLTAPNHLLLLLLILSVSRIGNFVLFLSATNSWVEFWLDLYASQPLYDIEITRKKSSITENDQARVLANTHDITPWNHFFCMSQCTNICISNNTYSTSCNSV